MIVIMIVEMIVEHGSVGQGFVPRRRLRAAIQDRI